MPRTGRPRVLDDAKRREICALVSAGAGLDAAARYVGCSVNTIRREALRNDDFRRQLRTAEVQMQLSPLQALRRAAGDNWRAAAWFLERTQPQRFSQRRPATCSPHDLLEMLETVIESAVEEIDDPELRDRICRRLLASAYKSSRTLAAAERSRLDPDAGPFDQPTTSDKRRIDKLLNELDKNRRAALHRLTRDDQNSKKCA